MKNIDINNRNAITAFSPEAHLIFRSASLFSKQQDQSGHQEQNCKKGKDMRSLSNEVENYD